MSTPRAKAGLAQHYRRYATGNLLALAAGFVSFPITTRLLSNAEFGVLGYWEVWVLLLTAVLKLGAGETIMRFHPHDQDPARQLAFATNIVAMPSLLALAGWLLLMAALAAAGLAGWLENPVVTLLACGTLPMAVWSSHLSWYMASREMSGLNATVNVTWRWVNVGVTLLVLLLWLPTATGVFAARVLVGTGLLLWSLWWMAGQIQISRAALDWRQVREGLVYGLPLAAKELSNIVLVMINRVMLKWLGADFTAVGIYTIGFSLAMYVDQIVSVALSQAFNPVANRLYNTDGAAAVVALKRRLLPPLTYLCVGLATAALIGGHDFIVVVASADKLASGPIFMLAAASMLLQPLINTAGYGLLLVRRSGAVFGLTAAAAALNIALNLVAIPRWGLMGAAAAVCASQLALQLGLYLFCPRELRCPPPPRALLLALGCAAVCGAAAVGTNLLGVATPWLRLLAAAGFVAVLYALPVMALDASVRQWLIQTLRARRHPGTSA